MTIQSKILEYTHGESTFEGYFAWNDAAATPCPVVLVSHAWGGLGEQEQTRARALAELGYAAFCLDLYGKGVRGSSPEENAELMQPFLDDRSMLQERMKLAVDVAGRQEGVDAARAAAIGFCFGGLCVLDLARAGGAVQGVVSFHGLLHPPGNTEGNRIDAKVLALHGWDDPLATPEHVVALASELTTAGADWQIHAYGHTKHAFTNPGADDPVHGLAYSESGDRRSWKAMADFLAELF